jgi:hypothetical protein
LKSWDLTTLDLERRLPEILSSSDAARVIVLDLAAGESLSEHEVHERACLVVLQGAIEAVTSTGERTRGGRATDRVSSCGATRGDGMLGRSDALASGTPGPALAIRVR